MARAAGAELGDLESVHGSQSETDAMENIHQMQRRTSMPLLAETRFGASKNELVSESPRAAEFVVTVHVTYELK